MTHTERVNTARGPIIEDAALAEALANGTIAGASKITEDKFTNALQPFGGTDLKTSLSESDERVLAEDLAGRS